MSLKFSVDVSGMDEVKRQLARACGRAESVLAQQVMKDTIPFVPALTGSLTQRTRVVGNEVIYPGPYEAYYTSASQDLEKGDEGVNYWGEIEVNFVPMDAQLRP